MTRYIRTAALTAALLIGTTVAAGAQGGPPGGGPPGGMGGGRRSPDAMALLEKALAGVDGITALQKDSLDKIEAAYKAKFTTATAAMREAMMSGGGPPDMAAMTKMREGTRAIRAEELAAARAVLTAAQFAKFDENVATEAKEQAERDAQMRQRMGGNPPE